MDGESHLPRVQKAMGSRPTPEQIFFFFNLWNLGYCGYEVIRANGDRSPTSRSTSSFKGVLNHGSEQTCYPTQLTLLKTRFLKIKHTSKMPLLLASLHPLYPALHLASDLSL